MAWWAWLCAGIATGWVMAAVVVNEQRRRRSRAVTIDLAGVRDIIHRSLDAGEDDWPRVVRTVEGIPPSALRICNPGRDVHYFAVVDGAARCECGAHVVPLGGDE